MADETPTPPAALPWLTLLPWQQDAARAALSHRSSWPHALLIHGPRGIGKHALALYFAQALLCEAASTDGLPCGECAGCRYAVAGQHPDLMRLELVTIAPDDGTLEWVDTISIDRVRGLTEFVHLTSHRQRAKVGVISPAERMNTAAANALLKTLEEPPDNTYLILVSDEPGRLMPTVLSRCRRLAAPVPTPADARVWLVAQGVGTPEEAMAQAAGAPLLALAAADPTIVAERRAWLAALAAPERLSVQELSARIDEGGKDERKARLAHALDWLTGWIADLARVAAGAPARHNPGAAQDLKRLASRVAPIELFRYYRVLLQQRALLVHPLQPRLVALALLIDYRALF
jgi:DNA polymerase-3 subunit delta'